MLPIILIGDSESRKSYIENFIKQLGVRPYDIIKYDHNVGIADVRYVQKMLSLKYEQNRVRLIVFAQTITIEAQNALLKTLEEVAANVQILIHTPSKDSLLPTVVSRAKAVFLSNLEQKDNVGKSQNLIKEKLLDQKNWDISLPFILEDSIPGLITKESRSIEELILSLRGIIIRSINDACIYSQANIIKEIAGEKQDQTVSVASLFLLLKKLSNVYPLIVKNNVNQRFAFETILLSTITTWES